MKGQNPVRAPTYRRPRQGKRKISNGFPLPFAFAGRRSLCPARLGAKPIQRYSYPGSKAFMTRATPKMRDFAERLILGGGGVIETKSPTSAPQVFIVFETLRPNLSQVIGNLGFSAVLSRALAIAIADFEWLRAVRVKPDGSLEGLGESEAKVDPKEMAEGRVVFLAEFVSLLVGLIGERLVLQLLHDAMPNVSIVDLYFL